MSYSNGLCFVIMSFAEDQRLKEFYKHGVQSTVRDMGFSCERVDEQEFNGSIRQKILDNLREARLIVADMTHARPNCYYELGMAHALGKEVIHISYSRDDIHFDVNDFNFIVYNGIDDLQVRLKKRIEDTVKRMKRQILHVRSDSTQPMGSAEQSVLESVPGISVVSVNLAEAASRPEGQEDIVLYSYTPGDGPQHVAGLVSGLQASERVKPLVVYCKDRLPGEVFGLVSNYNAHFIANMPMTLKERLEDAINF